MAKPIALLRHPPAFFKCRIALARQLSHQLSQGPEIVGGSINRHDDRELDSRSVVLLSNLSDSKSRSFHDVAVLIGDTNDPEWTVAKVTHT
jgi:hypothetical protein